MKRQYSIREVQVIRQRAVKDAIRRLPNVIAVYQPTTAGALAILLGPLGDAIVADVWDGIRTGWPEMTCPDDYPAPLTDRA